MTTTAASTEVRARGAAPQKNALYNALLGLASLAVLLQGVWAGLFVQEGKEYDQSWVEWHARGADVAIVYMPEEETDAQRTKELVEAEGQSSCCCPATCATKPSAGTLWRRLSRSTGSSMCW